MSRRLNESGQTLLEVLVAFVVAALVVGAIVITTLLSLRNAQFSQNQLQATKLAQQAIEEIRTIRDRDDPQINYPSSLNPTKFSVFLSHPEYCLDPCYFSLSDSSLNLTAISDTKPQSIGGGFSRQIIIQTTTGGLNQKTVGVKVSWVDASGSHESYIQTVLSKQ